MIKATFNLGEDRLHLSVRGHAEHSENGADIVCAAISGIFYALAGYLVNCAEDAVIHRLGHGYAEVECGLDAVEAMKQTCIGFLQIQMQYPNSVKVQNDVWDFSPAAIVRTERIERTFPRLI